MVTALSVTKKPPKKINEERYNESVDGYDFDSEEMSESSTDEENSLFTDTPVSQIIYFRRP